jgi:hypothetical protein
MQKEPAAIIAIIGGAIIAAVEVLGPEFFPDLQPVVIQSVQAIVAVLSVIAIRAKVFSPLTYEEDVNAALHQDPPPA